MASFNPPTVSEECRTPSRELPLTRPAGAHGYGWSCGESSLVQTPVARRAWPGNSDPSTVSPWPGTTTASRSTCITTRCTEGSARSTPGKGRQDLREQVTRGNDTRLRSCVDACGNERCSWSDAATADLLHGAHRDARVGSNGHLQ